MLMSLLVVLLVLSLVGGGFGHTRYGYAGWGPAVLILVVLLLFWFFGGRGWRF